MVGARWTNPSVRRFMEGSGSDDPIDLVAERAREMTLQAIEDGWEGPPFEPFALAGHLDVPVVARDEVADARLVLVEGKPRIEFNPNRRAARVRFSVAHELAHMLFDDFSDRVRERHAPAPSAGDDWQLEMLCNVAASELLMPAGSFPRERADDLSLAHLLDLRTQYGVSTEAVLRRVVRLTEQPAAVFVATRTEEGSALLDYVTTSRAWRLPVGTGWQTSTETVLRRATAVGYSVAADEYWGDHGVHVQAVGAPPYPGHRFPRIVGLLTPLDRESEHRGAQLSYVRGDATQPDTHGRPAILAHVVNNEARSWGGRGFASALASRRPDVHADFRDWAATTSLSLGTVHWTDPEGGPTVASMIAQSGYGDDPKPRLKLHALHRCLQAVTAAAKDAGAEVHMPLIGTGYGGTRWPLIRDLIIDDLCAAGIDVKVYVLPEATMPEETDSQLSLLA